MEKVQILISKKINSKVIETVDMGSKNTHTGSIIFHHIFATKFGLQFLVYKVCAFFVFKFCKSHISRFCNKFE